MATGQRSFRATASLFVSLVGFGSLFAATDPAFANDGGLAQGGSPRLLSGHPTVTMTSELIQISAKGEDVKVDCQFVFTNHGKACTVRMGFPDQGQGADDPDEEGGDNVMKTKPKTTFNSFVSYVNGKPIPTKLIRADQPGKYWHTKTVNFPANSVVKVHDVYTQRVSGGIVNSNGVSGSAKQIGYIVHTGSSWHGPIGKTEIIVTLPNAGVKSGLKAVEASQITVKGDHRDLKRSIPSGDIVVYSGIAPPVVQGSQLKFTRTNWRPKEKDDLLITFQYQHVGK